MWALQSRYASVGLKLLDLERSLEAKKKERGILDEKIHHMEICQAGLLNDQSSILKKMEHLRRGGDIHHAASSLSSPWQTFCFSSPLAKSPIKFIPKPSFLYPKQFPSPAQALSKGKEVMRNLEEDFGDNEIEDDMLKLMSGVWQNHLSSLFQSLHFCIQNSPHLLHKPCQRGKKF